MSSTSSRWRKLLVLPVLAGALVGSVTMADAAEPPPLAAELGGPLRADFYTSGMEVAPDGTLVLADTGNNQIVKLDQAGNEIWRVGQSGPDAGEFLRPRDVSVSSNGTIFVVDTENERISRLSAAGNWLGVVDTPARFFLGGTFGDDDRYYLADIQRKIRVFDVDGNEVQVISENATAGGDCSVMFDIRDATASSDGRVYVAGYRTNTIMVFDAAGTCVNSFGSQGTGDGQFRTPYGVSTAYDPIRDEELLYVADAVNNRVQVFDLEGNFVDKFGGPGSSNTPGTLTTLRRVAPAVDGSGDVWVADLWGWRIQRWERTASGWTFAEEIGNPPAAATPTSIFHENRGLAVDDAGTIYVMNSIHHQMVKMNPDGTIAGRCGTRGSGNKQFNWPRDVDIDEATGELWITDTKFNRLQVLSPEGFQCGFVAARGKAGNGDAEFNWPRAVAIRQSDRTAWFTDTQNNRVVVWDVAAKEYIGSFGTGVQGSLPTQFFRPMGIAVDEATGHIFVADTINNRIAELSAEPGATEITLVRHITNIGLNNPEALEVGPDGLLYVADTVDGEIVVVDLDTAAVVATFGAADGMDHPAGITLDAEGRIYVSDSFNDRILVYSDVPPPPVDMADPDATVTSPTTSQVFNTSPVTFTGTATDDLAVAAVNLAIRDNGTMQWWNGTTWQAGFTTTPAVLADPGTASTTWSYEWTPPATGAYALQVIAVDAASKSDPTKPWVPFSYAEGAADTANPNATVTTPTNGEALSTSPVSFTGNATDDTAVAAVRVAIRDNATLQWWNGSGWQGGYATTNAVLGAPGATATTWSLDWAPPATGAYAIQVTAVDGTGKVDATRPWVPFSWTEGSSDSEDPNAIVATPSNGQVLTASPVSITGTATDDTAVSAVRVAIRDNGTMQWWNGSGWQAGYATTDAVLADPLSTSTAWSLDWAPPASGAYAIQVVAVDGVGKIDPTKPWIPFSYSDAPADTAAPNGTVSTPASGGTLFGSPVTFEGDATDDTAVAAVRVAIRNNSTLQWWNGTGWQANFTTTDAVLAAPGTTSTGWSYEWAPPATGSYALQVAAVDTAAKVDPTKPWVPFLVS